MNLSAVRHRALAIFCSNCENFRLVKICEILDTICFFHVTRYLTFQILHVSGQIDIVCRGLFELFSGKHEYKSYKRATGVVIRQHQDIIALSDNIENLFSFIALMQFFTNTLVICCIVFVLMTVSFLLKILCWFN